MKVMIDIPEEFERDLQDKFKEFFERMIADIDYALEKQEPLLCGNYERETAEMFLSAFEKAIIILDDATNGDIIKAMFPNGKVIDRDGDLGYEILIEDGYSFCSWFDGLWWNAPYKEEVE